MTPELLRKLNGRRVVASVSGGKDSAALSLWLKETWRPLLAWKFEDVREIHARHGLAPNPLYLRGAERVGCWPCIFARKAEIEVVARTDPARIDLLEQLEGELTERAGEGRFWFHGKTSRNSLVSIRAVAEWSRTDRGGKQHQLFDPPEDGGCMRWGLCDTGGDK